MEISRTALLNLVKAARMSDRLAQDTKALLLRKEEWTVADEISGFLADVLFEISGERLLCNQDFMNDSQTMTLIRSDLSDNEVADRFEETFRSIENHPPVLMEREQMRNLVKKNGGYMYTPEGEFHD